MSPRGGPDAKVLVVAGGIGTGKSTVCNWLARRGAFVIEADRVGHEMLLRREIVDRLREAFGAEILDRDGRVDRRALGRAVFAQEERLRRLNAIVHPPLVEEIESRVAALRHSRAAELIVIDAALHFQFEPRLQCDAVLATTVDPQEQLRRIQARDGLDEAEARQRVLRQAAVLASLQQADRILDTGAEAGQVRRELIAIVDDLLGSRLAESEAPDSDEPFESAATADPT